MQDSSWRTLLRISQPAPCILHLASDTPPMRSFISQKIADLKRVDSTQSFGIDPRSLALFRVAIALVLLGDLWLRINNASAFYTDQGVLPRAAQIELFGNLPALVSFHMMNGTLPVIAILFALEVAAALALLVGYRTGVATFVSWIMLVSLHNRNPMVLQGGDALMRILLFWAMFLPLGARASLDRWLAPPGSASEQYPNAPYLSMGTFAALLQVCFVYWFTWALKSDAIWRTDGTAIGYALSIDQMNRPLGRWLLHYPDALRILTFATLELERFGPLIALVPWWRVRLLMVAVFVGFHWGMGLCLTLGIFTWIAPTAWLLFVPTGAWEFLAAQKFARQMQPRLRRLRDRLVFWCRRLNLKVPAPRPISWGASVLRQLTAAFFLFYVFAWNLRSLDFNRYEPYFKTRYNWIGDTLRLDQVWAMFAPFPLKEDGWMLLTAKLANGQKVDLITGGQPVVWSEPVNLGRSFRDSQWQKYLLNLWSLEYAPHRGYYIAYMVNQWNQNHAPNQKVMSAQLIYQQQNNLEGFRKDKVKTIVLWNAKY